MAKKFFFKVLSNTENVLSKFSFLNGTIVLEYEKNIQNFNTLEVY